MIAIRNASEQFFGNAQGKTVQFDTMEKKRGFFGGNRTVEGKILVQVETVKPEGGKDCWNFTGQVLSRRGSIKEGTPVNGFYRGSDGVADPGWRDNVSIGIGQVKTGWIKPA